MSLKRVAHSGAGAGAPLRCRDGTVETEEERRWLREEQEALHAGSLKVPRRWVLNSASLSSRLLNFGSVMYRWMWCSRFQTAMDSPDDGGGARRQREAGLPGVAEEPRKVGQVSLVIMLILVCLPMFVVFMCQKNNIWTATYAWLWKFGMDSFLLL